MGLPILFTVVHHSAGGYMIAMSLIAVHVYDCRTFCFPGHMPPETTIAGPRTFPVA